MSVGSRTVPRIAAAVLGGANAVFLLVLGGSIPEDDIIFGDLGAILVVIGLCMSAVTAFAWFSPRVGGVALLLVGGAMAVYGLEFTPQAGLLLGGAAFVAGILFLRG